MKVIFTAEAYKKLRAYIHGIEYEISGFGKVEKKDGDLIVSDVKIFPQVVTEAHTEMDAASLGQFWNELDTLGEDIGKWKLWWHSHVYMGASFSGTDIATIDEFDSEMPSENWMLSLVTNKLGKTWIQIDVFEPIRCTIKDLPWEVEINDQPVIVDVAADIKEKVTINDWKHRQEHKNRNIITFPLDKKPLSDEERRRLSSLFPMGGYLGYRPDLGDLSIEDGEIILDEHGNPT